MTQELKIALYQMNATVGDLAGNIGKLMYQISQAIQNKADVFIAPELAVSGYPPEDLLLRPDFYIQAKKYLDQFLSINGITLVLGCPYRIGTENFNSVFIIRDGEALARYDKMRLPNYEVFDEYRYFTPGLTSLVVPINGVKCGIVICEDMWDAVPIAEAKNGGAELILVINASPFDENKHDERVLTAKCRVEENELPLVYVNLVGGQDELIFDGASFALNKDRSIIYQAPAFREILSYLNYANGKLLPGEINVYPVKEARLYQALVLALRDYIDKGGFKGIGLGLSGGIDSALTLAIAVDALGKDRVMAVMMPSPYTMGMSIDDSREMVGILGVRYEEIAIGQIFNEFKLALNPLFSELPEDTTEENLQARIRGTLMMAISNKLGYLVITTGNKSEMTTGYATLYGDMAGGFALLKDLAKTKVYALAQWRNAQSCIIPQRIIDRPPTAELRENQLDQDSLPEYAILDAILVDLVENKLSTAEIIAKGFRPQDVERVAHLLKTNEYKRRQAAVGPRLTKTAFAKDWRYPNTNKFKF